MAPWVENVTYRKEDSHDDSALLAPFDVRLDHIRKFLRSVLNDKSETVPFINHGARLLAAADIIDGPARVVSFRSDAAPGRGRDRTLKTAELAPGRFALLVVAIAFPFLRAGRRNILPRGRNKMSEPVQPRYTRDEGYHLSAGGVGSGAEG